MNSFMNRWLQKLYDKAAGHRRTTANRKRSLDPPKFLNDLHHEWWQCMETLEPRVLLSSTLQPLDPSLDNQAEAAIVAELNTAQAQTLQTALSADSRAVWAWSQETHDMILNHNGERTEYLDFMKAKGITTVYLFVGNQNLVGNPDPPLPLFATEYAQIISDVHSRGMKAFALIGHAYDTNAPTTWNFAASQFGPSADHFQNVLNYNNGRPASEQFDGVNIDLEPWTFPEWDTGDQATIIGQYLDLADHLMQLKRAQDPGLQVGPAAPFWFNEHTVTWNGVEKPANEHVQDVFDYVTLQDYRDTALPPDPDPLGAGTITSLAAEEMAYADVIDKPVVIGIETNDIFPDPEHITFFEEGEVVLEDELALAKDYFLTNHDELGGFAIHDLGHYLNWAATPLTLQQAGPKGAQIYKGSENGDILSVDQKDVYSVHAEAGQTLTIVVTPEDDLTLSVELHGPEGNETPLTSATASGPGQTVFLQTVTAPGTGNYHIEVSGIPGSNLDGQYTVQAIINAAVEEEQPNGSSNDSLTDAQNIDGSFIRLSDGVERGAVLNGRIPFFANSIDEFYSFTVSDNQPVTLVLSGVAPGLLTLELWDENGVLQSESGYVGVDIQIKDFVPPAPGTYYARITTHAFRANYDLVILRGPAAFDDESNDNLAEAQNVTTRFVLGHVSDGIPPLSQEIEPNDDGTAGISLQDLEMANDLNGSFHLYAPIAGFSSATVDGTINSIDDQDFFKISMQEGFLFVDLTQSHQSDTPAVGLRHQLLDDSGNLVQVGGPLMGFYTLPAPGDYYVMVDASDLGDYTLYVDGVTLPEPVLDQDVYHFTADPGQNITVTTDTPGGGWNNLDPAIKILDSDGNVLAFDTDSADDRRNARVRFIVPTDGQYNVVVEAEPGTAGDYTLSVQESAISADSRAVWASSTETFAMLNNINGQRQEALDFMIAKGVTEVYLFVGNENKFDYLEPGQRRSQYESLISDMHDAGLQVFALIGGRGQDREIEPGGLVEQAFEIVLKYNDEHANPSQQFDGVNLDVEPWTRRDWGANRHQISTDFLEMGRRLMRLTNSRQSDLIVGATIPFWFDTFTVDWANNPTEDTSKRMHQHVQDLYDYTSILAFRDFADTRFHSVPPDPQRTDGVIDVSMNEILYADQIHKPLVVGVETSNLGSSFIPDLLSFNQENEPFMESQLDLVTAEFESNPGFSGFAVQDLRNYQRWVYRINVTTSPGLTTTEAGGTATFEVSLNSQPTADVSISVASDDTTEGTVSTNLLTFTPNNWATPQTVTITGVDDNTFDDDVVYRINLGPASSSDTNFNGLAVSPVTLINTDDDATAVNFNDYTIESYGGINQDVGPTIAVEDNGNALRITGNGWKKIDLPYNVTANTVLEFDFASTAQGDIHGIGFDTDNDISSDLTFQLYGTQQSFGHQDFNNYAASAPGTVHYVIPVGQFYTGQMNYLTFTNDHDVASPNAESQFSNIVIYEGAAPAPNAAINVTALPNLSTTEAGGTATFDVVLNSQPTDDVTIAIASDDTTEGAVSPASANLVFTPDNWDTPQTVTINGQDDDTQDGNVTYNVTIGPATSSDTNYNGLTANPVSITNSDDENLSVNFNDYTIESYGGTNQDLNPVATIEDNGDALRIVGNGWKKIDLPYNVTANTVLEFDFTSSAQGDIHGIGFDTDNDISTDLTFQLYGTQQSFGLQDFHNYAASAPGTVHYMIPIGQFYTGQMNYLTFTNDHDVASPNAESLFSNIVIREG